MNWKIALPALALTHALAGTAGFFIARSLLVKDQAWVEANRKTQETQAGIDQAAAAGVAANANAKPPAGFTPRVVAFKIQEGGASRVSFTSDAPLEEIVGTTTKVSGTLNVDAAALEKSTASPIAVAVGTLKTGIDKRDEHLQGEGWFDTAKYPDATFALTSIEPGAGGLWPGKTADITVHGSLTIKGIAKDVTTKATVGWFPHNEKLAAFHIDGDVLRVRASFDVKLSDFGMSAEVIGQKVAEVVKVDLNLTAVEKK